jgi:aminoglycoside 2''-phosphotransferase
VTGSRARCSQPVGLRLSPSLIWAPTRGRAVKTDSLPPPRFLKEAVRRAWPRGPLQKFRVDHTGWTNLMLEADGRWMFRIPRWPNSARHMGFEVRLLEYLRQHLSIPVPNPVLVGALERPAGWPFVVYRKLPGSPLGDLAALHLSDRTRLSAFLHKLFTQLAGLPSGPLRRIGARPGNTAAWSARFAALRRRFDKTGAGHLSPELRREILRQFEEFDSLLSRSRYRPVLLHGDLWPSHILWNRTSHRPMGVIDWEDSRFGDPAFDLMALGGLGRNCMADLVATRKGAGDSLFDERLRFYRRILPLPGLLFGIETGRRTVERAHLRQLRASLVIES